VIRGVASAASVIEQSMDILPEGPIWSSMVYKNTFPDVKYQIGPCGCDAVAGRMSFNLGGPGAQKVLRHRAG
jgi:hypothetical protein